MAANYRDARVFNENINAIAQMLRVIEANVKGMKYVVEYAQPYGAVVQISHRLSFTSWGEDIKVMLTIQGDNTLVDVNSECVLPTQIIDLGKNKENVNKIINYITSCCAYHQTGQPVQTGVFCPYCGNPVDAAEVFCKYCGNGLK